MHLTLTDAQIQELINNCERAQSAANSSVSFAESALLRAQEAKKVADDNMAFLKQLVTGKSLA